MSRCFHFAFLCIMLLIIVSVQVQAFAPQRVAFLPKQITTTATSSSSSLFACRTNAKKEKIKRNRENMRKFKTGGKKGISRRKLMKKALSSTARQEEAEFIAKCYLTVPAPTSSDDNKNNDDRRGRKY